MGNILRCLTGGDNHGDDHYRPHYHPTSEPGIVLQGGWGSPPRFQPDHHQLCPHGGVASLVQDLLNFESTSMVPEALRNNVTSSKKAQVKWYRNILEAYKNSSPPPKTPAEAARLVAAALSRIQRADLEGILAFYNLPIPSFSSASTSSDHQPSSLPEGIQFVLNTLPVHNKCIGDGDGFTAYVDTADPRESANVPLEVHEMVIERTQARIDRDYQTADALLRSLNEAGYKIITILGEEILAKKYRIRMRGIDAPELKMASGKESRNALVKLIGGKRVTIYVYGQDQFGRYVGDIYRDNVFIQEQMLKSGHVWHFKTYDKRPEFAQWEREARAAHRGLFASENPEKPWDWRRDQRNANIPVY
ncbi:probable staphylococcal-like nuclease CAN2 isoform X1 [Miscanthus floridulus]|uniref:probable staphylococcal-like nuclease CAN2 isoform X1 n=1 Tax=Miscanthus floridulus TaxID=154761 RepID=UPI003459A878